jgi:hypothetical protein
MANSFRFILESTAEITSYWDNRSRRSASWHIGRKLWTSHVQGRERRAYTFFSTCVYVGLLTLYVEGSASSSPSPVRTLCFLNKQPSFSVVLLILDNSQLPKDNLIPLSSSFTIRTPHPPTLVQSLSERRQQQQQLGTHYRPHWPNWKVKCCLCVYFTHDAPATRKKKNK